MPRQTRASRTRSRTQRPPTAARSAAPVATPVVDAESSATEATPIAPEVAPAATATPRAAMRTGATAARQSRAFVTDYNYVINELKQIFILTIVVLAILIALYFIIG